MNRGLLVRRVALAVTLILLILGYVVPSIACTLAAIPAFLTALFIPRSPQ